MHARIFRTFLFAVATLAGAIAPGAAEYPDHVVHIINPYPPGGSVDVMARLLAQKLSEEMGGSFIVETRAGAGGNTGAEWVAKSEPDGYTLFFTAPGPLVINPTLYRSALGYDPAKDFAPIALFGVTPLVLMVANDVPAKNVQELIALAKAKPGTLTFGSAGIGTTPHLAGELLKSMAKIDITHVPFRGTGPAMNDLIGGHIQIFFDLLPTSLPQIQAGKVRALANAGETRPAVLKDLPTVAEQGLPGFSVNSFYGFVAPAKMPEPAKARLIAAVGKVLKSPDVIKRMHDLGSEPGNAFGADFGTFMQEEARKWGDVIRKSGAHVD
ncbi:MAG TPA: tripartite tricarboxylate transporter substrate binding protein [Xanthobacteraceae bacterium]